MDAFFYTCFRVYSISQEICTRFFLYCALLWLYIDWFSHIIRLTSLARWQSNDCPSASKATLMNMDKYFMWIHYERLHNHNKAKHNKTVCIFLGVYCMYWKEVDTVFITPTWVTIKPPEGISVDSQSSHWNRSGISPAEKSSKTYSWPTANFNHSLLPRNPECKILGYR